MRPFRIPAFIEEYLREKAPPPFSTVPPGLPVLPPPAGDPGVRGLLDALLAAGREKRPVELDVEDSGDAVAAAAMLLALAARLGIPAPSPQGDLFDASPALAPLRLEVRAGGIAVPSVSPRALLAPRRGLSLSGAVLAVIAEAARDGALDYPSDFVAFDLETTGRDPWADEILEIGAVKFLGRAEAGVHSAFVRPRGSIPGEIVEMTGIDEGMVRDAPPPPEALRAFLGFCGGLPLVAHNAPFDVAFLTQQARLALGLEMRPAAEDTLLMSRWLQPEAPGHRLGDVARFLGVPIEKWHRAVSDARTAAGIYLALTDRDAGELRALRVMEHLDLAALGTVASGEAIEGESDLLVRRGVRMMSRSFCLAGCARAERMEESPSPRAVAGMLLSLDDRVKQRAALHVLAGAVTSR